MRHEALSAQIATILLEQSDDRGEPSPTARCGTRAGTTALAREFVSNEVDGELVVHLVSAHHGCGRPLMPPILDPAPVDIAVTTNVTNHHTVSSANTIDWTGPKRFTQLGERYGCWGLALLESIVRLADIWCSARSEEFHDHDG
jgi:CRISPR-associated endonuclease/helicase Cas3